MEKIIKKKKRKRAGNMAVAMVLSYHHVSGYVNPNKSSLR